MEREGRNLGGAIGLEVVSSRLDPISVLRSA